jgi:hypothetical protein
MCWINTYLGLSDHIVNNTKKNFVSKEFKEYANTIEIRTKAVLVKAYNSVGIIKQYHSLLQQIYQIIRVKLPKVNKNVALQIAFKALNNTAGPNRLIPTLLVFKAYSRIIKSDLSLLIVT